MLSVCFWLRFPEAWFVQDKLGTSSAVSFLFFFFLLHFSSASLSELRAALWIHFPVLERARVHSSSSLGPAQAARGSLKDHRRWEMKWGGTEGPCTAWLL